MQPPCSNPLLSWPPAQYSPPPRPEHERYARPYALASAGNDRHLAVQPEPVHHAHNLTTPCHATLSITPATAGVR